MGLWPVYLVSLFCAWFECETSNTAPYLYLSMRNEEKLLLMLTGFDEESSGPIAHTTLGDVEGAITDTHNGKEIYSFTGIPYGESPTGNLRFRDPVPKKPWTGIFKANEPSPFCIQTSGLLMGQIRGQEDCLRVDVHTPQMPARKDQDGPGLPVIIWIPASANIHGRSASYGPAYLLHDQNVIFVTVNVRFGIFGFLSTGDEASPGNWASKDQALAIEWVHDNIEAFGGDKSRLLLAGQGSGGYAAHSMLFTKHRARNYISGIFGIGGNSLCNHGLDGRGRVKAASDFIAKSFGCPTSREGKSWEMVECLRNQDPYLLIARQFANYKRIPQMVRMLGPTVEPNVPNAFITELPEALYEKGEVPPIPLILTKTDNEAGSHIIPSRFLFLPAVNSDWFGNMQKFIEQLGYRTTKLGEVVSNETAKESYMKLHKFYFGKESRPQFRKIDDFTSYIKMVNDGLYYKPTYKSLELHNQIAPTYTYTFNHNTINNIPLANFIVNLVPIDYGVPHGGGLSKMFPPLQPNTDSDVAFKKLVNMLVNFAKFGQPLHSTPSGELLPLWTTIGNDTDKMMTLKVGPLNNLSMVADHLPSTTRMQIWDQVKY